MENVKAVLFDLDNTLIVRGKMIAQVAHALIRDYFTDRADEYCFLKDAFCACFESGYIKNEDCYKNFIARVNWENAPDYWTFFKYWSFYYPFSATLMPDAVDLVQRLKAKGYKVGIITNGPIPMQNAKIDAARLRHLFDLIVISGAVGIQKPDPEIFRLAAKQLGCEPETCLYIGDHPRNDIFGAKNAGMKTAWLRGFEVWDDQYDRADVEIDGLAELMKLL